MHYFWSEILSLMDEKQSYGNMSHESSNPLSVMHEITPLSDRDCFYIADRNKSVFDYPIHCHPEYELNFIEGASGVRRTVGDSSEIIGDYELVLITGSNLEHAWEQGSCRNKNIREITIQFTSDILPDSLLQRNPFESIRRMLERARCGLSFPITAIMNIYGKLNRLIEHKTGFHAVLDFYDILHELSLCEGARELSSSAFARIDSHHESRRVSKIQEYIAQHYHEDIRLETLAELVSMTPVAFSRFFHQRTGRHPAGHEHRGKRKNAADLIFTALKTRNMSCTSSTAESGSLRQRRRRSC